jgi:hypothetical protein
LPTDTIFERFRSALFSMKDIPQAQALWAAYGLEGLGVGRGELWEGRLVESLQTWMLISLVEGASAFGKGLSRNMAHGP